MRIRIVGVLCALVVIAGRAASAQAGDAELDEVARIRLHLSFARGRLAERDVSGLSGPVAARRRAALDDLERYIERGVFPRRTEDGYAGRRPRFIDDRGVHCAVGQLIADSGEPRLARALDATYEYSYVPQMREPALISWAERHGFTVAELAMIQPEYEPPPAGPERTRSLIAYGKESISLRCARRTKPVGVVELRIIGDRRGAATATAITGGAFGKCLAGLIPSIVPRAERVGKPYTITIKVTTTDPATAFREAVGHYIVGYHCSPRPGPLAREATIEAITDREGLRVKVRTTPRNPETEACAEADATATLGTVFGAGTWELSATGGGIIVPRFTDEGVWRSLVTYGPTTARECGVAALDPRPEKLSIRATGRVDDRRFTLAIHGADDATFQRCLRDRLQTHLHQDHGTALRMDSAERYFRVDAPIDTTFTFDVAPLVP